MPDVYAIEATGVPSTDVDMLQKWSTANETLSVLRRLSNGFL